MEFTNIYYFYYINAIGGTETFLYQLAKKYCNYDLTIVYTYADEKQLERLRKYVRCVQFVGQEIYCKKAFFNYGTDIINHVHADDYYLVIHADYAAIAKRNAGFRAEFPSQINHFIGVSQLACDSFTKITGKPCELSYNPIEITQPRKVLNLISATRLSKEKGKKRMEQLAAALDAANIPFLWTVFTTDKNAIDNPSIAYMKPRLDISEYIKNADYLVQLSDNEGYCYSVIEALGMGVPVIVTPCPVFKELGLKDKENCYIVPFNMTNIPVEEIYNHIPKVEYTPFEDNWGEIIEKVPSVYQEEMKKTYKVKATNAYTDLNLKDGQLNRVPKAGEEWIVSYDRLQVLLGANRKKVKFVTIVEDDDK